MQLNQCFNAFQIYLQAAGAAKSTKESYQRTLCKFERFLTLSDRSNEVEQLKKEDLIQFLATCQESGEKRSSVILRAMVLKKFFGWLKDERIITGDPAERIPVPKERKRIPKYLSPAQVENLLNQPDTTTALGLRDRALLELLYSAGLRIGEALDLQISDIDWQQGFVSVRNGKGGRPRNVPMGNVASVWLYRYLLNGRKKLQRDCSELVFLSRSGEKLSRQAAAAAIREYAQRAGLPAWVTAHSLRHACATHMLEGGARVAYIQELLGHAQLNSTMIYTAVRPEGLKEVHSNCHPRK